MASRSSKAVLEIGFTVFIVLLASAVLLDSLNLPVSLREPLGSSTIPQIVCGLVIFFCIVLFVRSLRVLISEQQGQSTSFEGNEATQQSQETANGSKTSDFSAKDDNADQRHLAAACVFLLAVIFVVIIETRQIPAFLVTPVFLLTSMLVLKRFQRASVIPALVISVLVGVSLPLIFTEFFNVNLP